MSLRFFAIPLKIQSSFFHKLHSDPRHGNRDVPDVKGHFFCSITDQQNLDEVNLLQT